jgi:predicted transcriptional regulator
MSKKTKKKMINKRNQSEKERIKRSADGLKRIIEGTIDGTLDIPNNAIIMDPEILARIIPKRRMELLRFIKKYKPKSVQQLADLTGRKKQAVNRDLKYLEQYDIVKLEKHGRTVTPQVRRCIVILDFSNLTPKYIPAPAESVVSKAKIA